MMNLLWLGIIIAPLFTGRSDAADAMPYIRASVMSSSASSSSTTSSIPNSEEKDKTRTTTTTTTTAVVTRSLGDGVLVVDDFQYQFQVFDNGKGYSKKGGYQGDVDDDDDDGEDNDDITGPNSNDHYGDDAVEEDDTNAKNVNYNNGKKSCDGKGKLGGKKKFDGPFSKKGSIIASLGMAKKGYEGDDDDDDDGVSHGDDDDDGYFGDDDIGSKKGYGKKGEYGKKGYDFGKKGGYCEDGDDDDDDDPDISSGPTSFPTSPPSSAPSPTPTAAPSTTPSASLDVSNDISDTPTPAPSMDSTTARPILQPISAPVLPPVPLVVPTPLPTSHPSPQPIQPLTPPPTPAPTSPPTFNMPIMTPPPIVPPTSSPTFQPTFNVPIVTPPPIVPPTSPPISAPINPTDFVCNFSRMLSFKCGTTVFICNDLDDVANDATKGICAQQDNPNTEYRIVDTTTQFDIASCDALTGNALGGADLVPPPVCYCAHMIKAVQDGGFGSGFPSEIKCPPSTDGRNNAISNYACYYPSGSTSLLSDPQKEDANSDVDSCQGFAIPDPIDTLTFA